MYEGAELFLVLLEGFFKKFRFHIKMFEGETTEFIKKYANRNQVSLPIEEINHEKDFEGYLLQDETYITSWKIKKSTPNQLITSFMETVPLTERFACVQEIYQIFFSTKEQYPSCPENEAHADTVIPLPFVKEGLFCPVCGTTVEKFGILMEGIDPERIMVQLESSLSLFRILRIKPHHTLEEEIFDENYFTFLDIPFITYEPDQNIILVKIFDKNIQKISFNDVISMVFQNKNVIGTKLSINGKIIPLSNHINDTPMKDKIIDLTHPELNQLLMDWFDKSNANYEAFEDSL